MSLEQKNCNFTGGPLRVRPSCWGNGPDPDQVWELNVELVTPASFSQESQDDDFIDTAWCKVPQTAIERHMYNKTPSDNQTHPPP